MAHGLGTRYLIITTADVGVFLRRTMAHGQGKRYGKIETAAFAIAALELTGDITTEFVDAASSGALARGMWPLETSYTLYKYSHIF